MSTPLTYLICPEANPLYFSDTLPSESQERINMAPLSGDAYKEENKTLFAILQWTTVNGPEWMLIKTLADSQDGKAAFLKLWSQFLGLSHKSTIVLEAKTTLEKLTFTGEKRHFSFENFLTRIISAFNNIKNYLDMKYSETTKVHKLLARIQCPLLAPTKMVILSNTKMMSNFKDTKNLFITVNLSLKQQSKIKRLVASASGRGRGQGRDQGRDQGHN